MPSATPAPTGRKKPSTMQATSTANASAITKKNCSPLASAGGRWKSGVADMRRWCREAPSLPSGTSPCAVAAFPPDDPSGETTETASA
jgi:hypothetical protein